MKLFTYRFIMTAILSMGSVNASASDIAGPCMVSYNVRNRDVITGVIRMNCVDLEARRLELFKRINAIPPDKQIDPADLTKQLTALEDKLKQSEASANWIDAANNITGNMLATLGLAACAETAGAGCAVAVVGKVLSVVGLVRGAMSEADKARESAQVRAEIAKVRQGLQRIQPSSAVVRQRLVDEFNSLCTNVKQQCLN
ncbi:hypothetical protein [Cupriavidus lacunae]|uniref:Uncharacterized protein n=1 Tax=Cupriavidus lacunae TaxID=2666307 RepID=A0A370NIF9_9BURK|nr:hypothetical protein [Cupriavidus lacunae]RDK05374.1 hypothetical protein DN412_37415 [Cupriavidus lacunae]